MLPSKLFEAFFEIFLKIKICYKTNGLALYDKELEMLNHLTITLQILPKINTLYVQNFDGLRFMKS